MRETPRTRRPVSPTTLRLLTPLFRHSITRDAWVLRGIGNEVGPVLVRRRPARVERGAAEATARPDAQQHSA